jgi:hypothetical protein
MAPPVPPPGNPPKPPPPPSFSSDDAEAEIRRTVNRHHQQVAEIATLRNDVDHWRHRAELAEGEVENLQTKIVQLEMQHEADRGKRDHEVDELKEVINTLQAQFEAGARIWLGSYDVLKRLNPKVVTPQQLEAPDEVRRDTGN